MKTKILLSGLCVLFSCYVFGQPYLQNGGNVNKSKQAYIASKTDESGVLVTNEGTFSLENSKITTSGNTSSQENSSFFGLNAGVLAKSGSKIILNNCTVYTSGTGANGVFATGKGSSVILNNDTIICLKEGGHGVDATLEGSLTLNNVYINTSGAHGAAISTDRGGGTVVVNGGEAIASGEDSPGIYSTGSITVSNAIVKGASSEAAVIEGANTITLTNTQMTAAKGTRDRGVFIYQSMSGDAIGNNGVFSMTGGSLTWPSATGPLFYISNTTGVINLSNVTINNSSPILIKAAADVWGHAGTNGGNVVLTADSQILSGNIISDEHSSVSISLKNKSVLTGAINKAAVTIDATSIWVVAGDSYITTLSDNAGITGTSITNIKGNGFTVYYDSTLAANSFLGGKTYTLNGGGFLKSLTKKL
ncbi:MAG: hypothetical protein WCX31_22540 [Salinivirgaceae bacterium]|jgi:hypothetical protein